jgi:hypothetical protein
MPKIQSVAFVVLACCIEACVPEITNSPIITKYGAAACVPFSAIQHLYPTHVREWDTALTLRDGAQLVVKGFDSVSSNVTVSYAATGQVVVAADPNDYIYPSDVRLDAQNELLYVKAHGSAVLGGEQTWLFEFDLRRQRITERTRVRNDLPFMQCAEPSHSQ